MAHGVAVEVGAVEQGGRGRIGHRYSPLSEGTAQDSCFPGIARGGVITQLKMMNAVQIVPITLDHVESFRRTLDFVARERRYLAFLEAPPLESTREYVRGLIEQGYPQFVAVSDGEVCGWCDVAPKGRPIYAHSGVLGMGLLPPFRGRGTGMRLILRTLDAAREFGLRR